MNRLDLIIDALQKAKDGWQCFDEYEKALAAARELKALKPVAWMVRDQVDGCRYPSALKNPAGSINGESQPLYALDEVNDV
jgi:hypothetical protein